MYTILVNENNTMSVTENQRIIQRSKLVDTFRVLSLPMYNGLDMRDATVLLEYVKPVSREYKTEILELSQEMYKEHLQYILPIDTEFTKETGNLEFTLSFISLEMQEDGSVKQRVRKIAPAIEKEIIPVAKWRDVVPDAALSPIDQRLIKLEAQRKAFEDMAVVFDMTKADDISYENNELQLIANGQKIGTAVNIGECDCEDGVPVVDFSNREPDISPEDPSGEIDNVVEFDPVNKINTFNNVVKF